MRKHLRLFAAAVLTILPAIAFAQDDAHHPDDGTATPPPASTAAPVPTPPGRPADQSANAMQMMGQMMPMMEQMMPMMGQMMPMMEQMMQMMQGGMMPGMSGGGAGMPMAGMSDAGKAYMSAMANMNGPMMQAMQSADPDIAFVKAMIPHHQGAIDMAKAVLAYGKDEKVKTWANKIIAAQEAEIAEMQAWLNARGG